MKVVIVGGGFGGLKTALNLSRNKAFEVTLVSERSSFEYHAALYRSATGRSVLEVQIPFNQIFPRATRVKILADRAKLVNVEAKTVVTEGGEVLPYDNLVLALGNVTEYYGITGLAEYSFGIKSIQEALELKQHLHKDILSDKIDSHYVVVGGGATGVELAGELVSYLKRLYAKHQVKGRNFQVDLVEAAPRLLPILPENVSNIAAERLTKLGVKIYLNTAVKGETVDSLMLPDGSIDTHTVVWTAGVANNPFFKQNAASFKLGKGNRVEVDGQLQAAPGVYVLGDSAATPKTGWAQTALYDADFISQNLDRSLKGKSPLTYLPKQPIAVVPIGPKWCVALWGKLTLRGRPGWWLRRLADLKLFMNLLPPGVALNAWVAGSKVEETCPVCKS